MESGRKGFSKALNGMSNPPATNTIKQKAPVRKAWLLNCLRSLECKLIKKKNGGKIGSKEKYHIMDSQKDVKSRKALA